MNENLFQTGLMFYVCSSDVCYVSADVSIRDQPSAGRTNRLTSARRPN